MAGNFYPPATLAWFENHVRKSLPMSVFPPLPRICGALLALALLAGCAQQTDTPPDVPASPAPTVAATSVATSVATPMPTATPPTLPTAVPLPTWTPIPTPVARMLFVDAAQDRGPISPQVYGSGYGPWVSLRPQTIPLAQESGVTVLRYPGGAWGDQNDLQAYHIDQFAGVAREIVGAEPYIHVRFTGSTPAYATSVVKYANVDKGYDVQYWSIGNEPSLYEAVGHGWTAAEFAAEWRKFAEAMKAVDPTILLVGPEIHQWAGIPAVDPKDSAGADWLRTFLQANGDLVDIVSIHRYPFPNNARRTSAEPDELRANAAQWTAIVRRLRDVVPPRPAGTCPSPSPNLTPTGPTRWTGTRRRTRTSAPSGWATCSAG